MDDTYGYWTSTPDANDSTKANVVYSDSSGLLDSDFVNASGESYAVGIRTVITILKSNIE